MFPEGNPSICEISDRAARLMLARLQRIILDATSSDPRDLGKMCKRDTLIFYAVRVGNRIHGKNSNFHKVWCLLNLAKSNNYLKSRKPETVYQSRYS